MMMPAPGLPPHGLPDPQPDLAALPDPHARALGLAAQRPTESLGPIDSAWLVTHLEGCDDCRATAAAYEADRLLLRGLRDRAPQAPRDLWARTSAALEREATRPVRIRRASRPPRPAAPYRPSRWSPGIVSGLLVVALVAGSSLLAGLGRTFLPSPSASGAAATPIAVTADVRWIQTGTDGSFDIVLGQVDRVCPPTDPGSCGPLQDVSRTSISLGAAPRSVSLSPATGQLVVVAGNETTGGAVYVVPVPSSLARPSASPVVPSRSPATAASPGPSDTPSPTASGGAGSPAPSGAIAIVEDVIVVGGTAGHSPDGQWFAFAARPADGSAGPDIYAWRVGDARARAITTDHRSVFSGWLGNRILGSRIDGAEVPAPTNASPVPSGSLAPGSPTPSSSPRPAPASPGPGVPSAGATPAASASATATPSATVPPGLSASPATSSTPVRGGSPIASPAAPGAVVPSASVASIRPGFVVATERGVTSFLLDPDSGLIEDLGAGRYLRPVVDPTGAWAVYWDGTVVSDRQGVDWMPGTGRLVVAPWVGPTPGGAAVPGASPSLAPSSLASTAPSTAASAPPSGRASGTAPSPAASAGVTIAPSVRPASSPSPSPRATAGSASGSVSPRGSVRPAASEAATISAGPQHLVGGPMLDFDAAFDPSGTHLAIWIADPTDPAAGSLTLFTLRNGTWSVDPQHRLVEVPALRGFSIAAGELVWVTPPDATGQGSRIEVVGWTADGFGSVQSIPGGCLIVIR